MTPFETQVKRKDTIFVTITKSGYKQLDTAVISSIDGASLGIGTAANILFLPVINDIVDYKVGANYSHKPNPLIVTLIPVDSAATYQLAPPPGAPATAPAAAPAPATAAPATPTGAAPTPTTAPSASAPAATTTESAAPATPSKTE